jgi:probable F420-dependent oxidoreductase
MARLGLTVPLSNAELSELPGVLDRLEGAGFTDLWSAEVSGADAFTPLVVAATTHPSYRLGTAIVPAFTRSPALIAMSAASLASAATSEVLLGIGSSSDVIVQQWNGVPFVEPYQKVRDVVRFLRQALTGERVDFTGDTFEIRGFRLTMPLGRRPKIVVAALRPGMLKLAGRESDGAIVNWLSADDVQKVVPYVLEHNPDAEIVARIFTIPTDDIERGREMARRQITAYLNVPVYAEFHRWLGRGDMLQPMWDAWKAGDRRQALKEVPEDLIDQLLLIGDADRISAGVQAYRDAGITTPMLSVTADEENAIKACQAIGARVGVRP